MPGTVRGIPGTYVMVWYAMYGMAMRGNMGPGHTRHTILDVRNMCSKFDRFGSMLLTTLDRLG
jgi:hypothetical protein